MEKPTKQPKIIGYRIEPTSSVPTEDPKDTHQHPHKFLRDQPDKDRSSNAQYLVSLGRAQKQTYFLHLLAIWIPDDTDQKKSPTAPHLPTPHESPESACSDTSEPHVESREVGQAQKTQPLELLLRLELREIQAPALALKSDMPVL
jgi:hypothetical protein